MRRPCTLVFTAQWVFTITNFVVHPTHKGSQLTDGDIVGVRLPHRSEFQQGPGADQDLFVRERTRPYFILAEIKRGLSELNQSWRQPPHQPVMEMLQDLGPFRKTDLEKAASHLVTTGFYETDAMYASLFFIGTSFTPDLPSHAPRKTWDDLIRYIHRRFSAYHNIKTDHEQWDKLGKDLWELFVSTHKEEERFLHAVQEAFHHSDTNG